MQDKIQNLKNHHKCDFGSRELPCENAYCSNLNSFLSNLTQINCATHLSLILALSVILITTRIQDDCQLRIKLRPYLYEYDISQTFKTITNRYRT